MIRWEMHQIRILSTFCLCFFMNYAFLIAMLPESTRRSDSNRRSAAHSIHNSVRRLFHVPSPQPTWHPRHSHQPRSHNDTQS